MNGPVQPPGTVRADDPPPTAEEYRALLRRVGLLEDQVAALRDSIARERSARGGRTW